ncbi:UDP-N-acetylmuramoylalanine--D-glutamate ligase [Candidatus Roizmanbacteria bacterium RIFCSPLOWO2_12_FULL_37_7b]|nr:MAG: UDP-N-acetylmuramoylalanine--D-glutamate ligase [Candidatus Roizmanbacteria bacterium RIFCSPLOWO2_12_FULL_37_7b]
MKIDAIREYKKILILGYGVEGRSTEKFLRKFAPDVTIETADQKDGPDYLEKQKSCNLVIKSPGIPKKFVTKPYTTATNIFFANSKYRTIGITGTKGKSTTSHLVHSILRNAGKSSELAGNIGEPMLDLLLSDIDESSIIVLELSSYQLEDIQYSPHVSCILNIYQELHNHVSFGAYFEAKAQIAKYASKKDYYVYNSGQLELEQLVFHTKAQPVAYKDNDESDIGPFYQSNVSASLTVTSLFGINRNAAREIISQTKPLPHRHQYVGIFKGIKFYNDSAANHPAATLQALSRITNVSTILLGGQNREYDFRDLVEKLFELHIDNIVLFPDTEIVLEKLINKKREYRPRIFTTNNMEDAVDFAYKHSPSGTACLLSPGAPSYTMFRNFPERGNEFMRCVKQYEEKEKNPQKTSN